MRVGTHRAVTMVTRAKGTALDGARGARHGLGHRAARGGERCGHFPADAPSCQVERARMAGKRGHTRLLSVFACKHTQEAQVWGALQGLMQGRMRSLRLQESM